MTWHTWEEPLLVSAAVTLVAVPLARLLAVRTGFLDRPAPHKAHSTPTPYLGGVAICLGVLVAILVARTTLHSGIIGVAAAVLFAVGLFDDRRGMRPALKLAIQGVCALGIFVIGFHLQAEGVWLHLTGVRAIDLVPTFALFILIPNSVNLLDNTDGCAAGVVAASAACVLAESVLRSQHDVPIAAAAITGALLAFLAFNRRPASIFMGDAGSLPLGLLLAVLAVRTGAGSTAPVGAEVSLLFLGIPLADTATVLAARLTHGRSIFQGGQDHLSHRFVYVTGMSIGWATWILIAAQAALGGVAIGVSVGALSEWLGLVLAVAIVAAVMIPALRPAINRAIYRTVPLRTAPSAGRSETASA